MAKMKLHGHTLDLDPRKLLNVELILIEKTTGMPLKPLMTALQDQSMTALTALIWVLLRRQDMGLRLEDVSFSMDELVAVGDDGNELQGTELEGAIAEAQAMMAGELPPKD